jgi:hypothetical protein
MANDYTVPYSDEIYLGQINDSEADLESLLGLCQVGLANDSGLLVYKNYLGTVYKTLRGEDFISGYIVIPSDENVNVLERTSLYSNGYDLTLPDNRYIGNESYNNMLRLTDSNIFIVDADETITGDLEVQGTIKLTNNGHTAEFILSDTGVLTIEIDGIDQGVEYYNEE